MCHLYFHTADSINDTKPAVFLKPIKAAWLGCFVSPAFIQQSRRKGGQHREASVRIITRKGKFVASVGGAKILWWRALHKGDGKVCSRAALLVCPQGNVQRDKWGRMLSASGCTGRTHQSLSASLSLQEPLKGLDLVHPMHSLVFGK